MRFFATLRMTLLGLLEVLPDQPVLSPARAREAVVQATAAFAYPPYLPGRHAGHKRIIFHIIGHNGARGNQSATPYRMTTHYRAIRAQRCALAHARTRVNSVHREVRPRSIYIRKDTGRTTENIVLYLNALIHGDVVLDPHTIPYPDIVRDVDVLSQRTVPADDGSPLNVTKMPNLRSLADAYAIVDIRTMMNEIIRHPRFFKYSRGIIRPGYAVKS